MNSFLQFVENLLHPRTVIILRAASGAGKSTYVKNNHPSATVASADNYFIQNGEYKFDPKELAKAHEYSFQTFKNALDLNKPEVVVDNTNTRKWEFEKYCKLAKERGYKVVVVRLMVDPNIAAARNVHGVPAATIKAMIDRFEDYPGEIVINNN